MNVSYITDVTGLSMVAPSLPMELVIPVYKTVGLDLLYMLYIKHTSYIIISLHIGLLLNFLTY